MNSEDLRMTLCVIIPTHPRTEQDRFLRRAIESVRVAALAADMRTEIIVAQDEGAADLAPDLVLGADKIVKGGEGSAATAVNAAMCERTPGATWIAFLEDDDYWEADRLLQWQSAPFADFYSAVSLEKKEDPVHTVVRVNDFPIPSTWLFNPVVWDKVGGFDADFKIHHDNEWLGRLGRTTFTRVHMVESIAPADSNYLAVRPWLSNVMTQGGPHSTLWRMKKPTPNIVRAIHEDQGEQRFKRDREFARRSKYEYSMLVERFGRIPW
jgi:hypothetical protein